MMEIPPGNIDHFELKCLSLKEVKKYFSNGRIGLDVQKNKNFPLDKRKWLINVVRE